MVTGIHQNGALTCHSCTQWITNDDFEIDNSMLSDDEEENKTTDDIDETQTSEEGDANETKATATAAPQTPPRALRSH